MSKRVKKQTNVNNPHDKFFKAAFSLASVARGYLTYLFSPKITAKLDLDSLVLDSNSYISDKLKPYYSDIVWRCQLFSGKWVQVAFLFEHKSYKPIRPHLQILRYMLETWDKHDDTQKPLMPIIPIVVYHGVEKWEKETFESNFEEIDTDLMPFLPHFDFWLTNLQDYPDEMIKSFNAIFLQKSLLAFKHFSEQIFLKTHFAELLLIGYHGMTEEEALHFIRFFHVYLYQLSGGISDEEINEQIIQLDDTLKLPNMDIIEKILEMATEKGIEKGKKMAIYDAWLRCKDMDLLANLFGLSSGEIKMVIQEMRKNNSNS